LFVEQEEGSGLNLDSVYTGRGSQRESWLLIAVWPNAGPSRRWAIHAKTERLFQGSETVRWGPSVRELIVDLHLDYHPGDSCLAAERLRTDKAVAKANAVMG
jgi:hypothetical protein